MLAGELTRGRSLTWFEKFEETAKECEGHCVDDDLGTAEALELLRAAKDDDRVDQEIDSWPCRSLMDMAKLLSLGSRSAASDFANRKGDIR